MVTIYAKIAIVAFSSFGLICLQLLYPHNLFFIIVSKYFPIKKASNKPDKTLVYWMLHKFIHFKNKFILQLFNLYTVVNILIRTTAIQF